MTYDIIWIGALVTRIVIRKTTGIRIEVVIGTFLYGLFLVSKRLLKKTISNIQFLIGLRKKIPQIKRLPAPERVSDFNKYFRLRGMEVILDPKGKLRVDLNRYHTLAAGVTGSGKTCLINSLLIQLVDRPGHETEYDIYLIDLKGSEQDYLYLWKPVLAGYYSINETGSTEQAIEALEKISELMHSRGKDDKKIALIIDELAMLTEQSPSKELERRGTSIVMKLASQLRDKGMLFMATQRPHFRTIPRNISSCAERKICFRVDDLDTAKLILRTNNRPDYPVTHFKEGEFILREPKREVTGRTLMVNMPAEIDELVSSKIDLSAENDPRLGLFKYIASTLPKYGAVPGVNKVYKAYDGLNQKEVEAYYRNYVNANALIPNIKSDGKNGGNKLADEYQNCVMLLRNYIANGKWCEDPPIIGKN